MPKTEISELTQGWHAAAACEPYDPTMPRAWREGWQLWRTRETCRRDVEKRPRYPYESARLH